MLHSPPRHRAWLPVCALLTLSGCTGPQSSLDPAGRDASRIFELFVVMTAGATIVWLLVVGLTYYATRIRTGEHHPRFTRGLIVGGGVIAPIVVLGALLFYGLAPLPKVLALPAEGGPVIEISGEQWWWRVRYVLPDGRAFELANEVRLPVGERIEVRLESADVIHSFWLPAVAGKMDVVPGRTNRVALEPTRTGTFRGVCAEYCGTSHARMGFYAVVLERGEFDVWVEQQLSEALPPPDAVAARGQDRVLANGCVACHTIRGTSAQGRIGPDLTHVAGRLSIGAAMLPPQAGDFQRWIQVTERVKPGVHMPSFNMLPPEDVRAMASYLSGLR